jgi:hypothetical protein
MATINELKKEINNYLFPNILNYDIEGEVEYQINGIWIDQLKEDYFFNESLILTQMIEDTVSKSDNPISIIDIIKYIFEKRLVQLDSWKKTSLNDYFIEHHAIAISENDQDIISYKQSKVKKINADHLLKLNEKDKLFKLSAFYNMIIGDKIHKKEEFADIKLLYHIYEFKNNVRLIFNLLEEIIHDYVNFKIVKFDDYFKSFYNEHANKIQVDLKLKDLAYFFYFVYSSGLFVMHQDKSRNKKMLMEFFVKNFMYTSTSGNPTHFKKFIKEISDITTEDAKFQRAFADELIYKINKFKSLDILHFERADK